jgi:hypothetical protein
MIGMFKHMVLLEPVKGADLEAYWKYWVEDFGPRHIDPVQIRNCINRVIQIESGSGQLWGMAEGWSESEESFRSSQGKHQNDEEFKRMIEEWHHRWSSRSVHILEEKRLFERPDWKKTNSGMVKHVVFLVPKDGMDLEATWKYWVEDYGPRHIVPGQLMICINRVIKVPPKEGQLWGIAEGWYENMEAFRAFQAQQQSNPEMKKLVEKWHSQWASHASYFMEEKVLFQR